MSVTFPLASLEANTLCFMEKGLLNVFLLNVLHAFETVLGTQNMLENQVDKSRFGGSIFLLIN